MRWIEPGSFLMGCDPDDPGGYDHEKPQHWVTLTEGYWLADTACTQGLWQAVTGQNPSDFKGSADLPVESVSWDDVTGLFLPKVAQRLGVNVELPTEAEWEFACRAGTQTPYWFGQGISENQVNFGGEVGKTVPVKGQPANGWGLYQMHGNVWEWCEGSLREYKAGAVENPSDGQDKEWRVLRGGAWLDPAREARSAFRDQGKRVYRFQNFGFRFTLRSIKPSR
jgi:formylglycine-generating enzyme required for sulfatase activity